jgi:hypothetical protein
MLLRPDSPPTVLKLNNTDFREIHSTRIFLLSAIFPKQFE